MGITQEFDDGLVSTCVGSTDSFPCNANNGLTVVSFSLVTAFSAVLVVGMLGKKIEERSRGSEAVIDISDRIQAGARLFLYTQYKHVSVVMLLVTGLLVAVYSINPPSGDSVWDGARYGFCFLAGVLVSACAGWDAMLLATDANSRTANAADEQISGGGGGAGHAMRVAFTAGTAIGLTIVSLGLLGTSLMFYLMTLRWDEARLDGGASTVYILAVDALTAFGFGASAVALFTRVSGGIFATGTDVGAELVLSKLDPVGIGEYDIRSPATIADLLGDNVGDVAGMSADLLESYISSMIASLSLARGDVALLIAPLWMTGAGILASIMGFCFVNPQNVYGTPEATQSKLLRTIYRGTYFSSFFFIIFSLVLVPVIFKDRISSGFRIYGCVVIGLMEGLVIQSITEYFTSYTYSPTRSIARAGHAGPAMVVIQGLGMGMLSCSFVALSLATTMLATNALAGGPYGISMASIGMLATLGLGLASNAYGPIVDNARWIARLAGLSPSVRDITDRLVAMGNTTAATGKGLAIGSAVLTSLSLLSAFKDKAQVEAVPLSDPLVLCGLLLGAMMPFLFASMTMLSVQKTANAILLEVQRQYRDMIGLAEGVTGFFLDAHGCIAVATRFSLGEMILPGLYALLCPLIVGFLVGPKALSGMLAGSICSGSMLATMLVNSGGAWDNSNKYIEIERVYGGKQSKAHAATSTGDNVGDHCKDTAGPSLNILIKLMSIISLVIAPLLVGVEDWELWRLGLVPLTVAILATICL